MKKQIKITIEETIGKETTKKEFIVKKQHYTKKEIEEYSNDLYRKEVKELFNSLETTTESTKLEGKTLDDLIEFLESKSGITKSGTKYGDTEKNIYIYGSYYYDLVSNIYGTCKVKIGKIGDISVYGSHTLVNDRKDKLREIKEFMGWD